MKVVLIQKTYQLLLHLLVDVAVAGEGFRAFLVTGARANKIRVFDLFVDIADETAASHV